MVDGGEGFNSSSPWAAGAAHDTEGPEPQPFESFEWTVGDYWVEPPAPTPPPA